MTIAAGTMSSSQHERALPSQALLPSTPFSGRIQRTVDGWLDPALASWIVAAARVLDRQLDEAGATPHRVLAGALAHWLNIPPVERDGLGDVLDLLQLAIDMADNLADAHEDEDSGRSVSGRYQEIPPASRFCLPAFLVATSRELLQRVFGGRPQQVAEASQLIHEVLGRMVRGQGCPDPLEKARLVSGEQAKLLCLPAWLCAPHPELTDAVRADLLSWAVAWGTSWELGFRCHERPTPSAQEAWLLSLHDARARWPKVGPFLPGRPLAADALVPGLC